MEGSGLCLQVNIPQCLGQFEIAVQKGHFFIKFVRTAPSHWILNGHKLAPNS